MNKMAKKNFNDVTAQLANQAKQRFNSSDNEENIENKEDNAVIETVKKEPRKQKTIYLSKTLLKLLKKASYIKDDLDQSDIVAIALEKYFADEGIYLEKGEY